MRVLLIGSGGREHALARALVASPVLTELHAAPGNPGIARLGRCHPVKAADVDGLVDLAAALRIDLAVVGPEAPLVAGAGDALRRAGILVFGPGGAAARIEGSKAFAKEVMAAAGVPAAATLRDPVAPCVVKADGLAAGKGVFVCTTHAEVDAALPRAHAFGNEVLIEELLVGEEASVFVVADGERCLALPAAQDYKRIGDGDTGPNTGGMGAYSPVPRLPDADIEAIVESVHRPVLAELAARGTPFVGVLYAGLMLTDAGPRVLEFNARMGDPETQVVLPRLETDFLELVAAAAGGDLGDSELRLSEDCAVTVVLASRGYPETTEPGVEIRGLEEAEREGAIVFHAGTALRDGRVVSAGGRVLNVTALGGTVAQARERVYAAIERIDFPGCQYRTDIALRAVHA
ncbi:MAG: phosphoribosylamine--glycine ligase [Gaiellales bacterium]